MKKILSLTLAAVLLLALFGCTGQKPPPESKPAVTETTGAAETTSPTETTAPQTEPPETISSMEASEVTSPTEATEETKPTEPEKPKENTGKQGDETKPANPSETQPTQPATEPTDPPTTQPAETEPPATEPPSIEPPSAEPTPTEPAGCQHDWMCVHHDEEGHWRAGIVCDCGWAVYGDPDGLVSQWNAHSESYPAEESLFEHGGFGCVDEWIVDKPAYDEWVCRHCAEAKP